MWGLAKDLFTIATTPVRIAVKIVEPVVQVVKDVAEDIEDAFGEEESRETVSSKSKS